MTEPIVTVSFGEEEGAPVARVTVAFSTESAPSLDSEVGLRFEWRSPPQAPLVETSFQVIKWGRTVTRDPVENDWPAEDRSTRGLVATLRRRGFSGVLQTDVTWLPVGASATRSFVHVADAGTPTNAVTTSAKAPTEPELCVALRAPLTTAELEGTRTTEATPAGNARFAFHGQLIHKVLAFIHTRLQAGLGGFWFAMGPDCRDPSGKRALCEVPNDELADLTPEQLDECWAQLATEMTAGTLYHGPGSYLGVDELQSSPVADVGSWHPIHRKDARFFGLVRSRADQDDLCFSLVHACQQLCTAVLMSRSADFYALADDPLDSGASKPNGNLPGATKQVGASGRTTGKVLAEKGWLVPGACYYRKPENRHVAVVIRAYDARRFQMVDTGAMNLQPNPFPKAPLDKAPPEGTDPPGPGVTYDSRGVPAMVEELHSVLVPPKVERAPLTKAIERLKTSRCLGYARLVIALRVPDIRSEVNAGRVLWVSRRLPMHEGSGDGFRHYPITRLLASLRGCPHADRLDVRWQLFTPLGQAALTNVFDNGRTQRWWESSSPGPGQRNRPVAEFVVTQDGVPTVRQRSRQSVPNSAQFPGFLDQLENVQTGTDALRGTFNELADVGNASLPEYFRK